MQVTAFTGSAGATNDAMTARTNTTIVATILFLTLSISIVFSCVFVNIYTAYASKVFKLAILLAGVYKHTVSIRLRGVIICSALELEVYVIYEVMYLWHNDDKVYLMKKIKSLLLLFVAMTSLSIALAPTSYAEGDIATGDTAAAVSCPGGKGDGAKTSFSFAGKGGTNGGVVCVSDLIKEVMTFMTGLAGLAVVVGISMGGIKIATAQGNSAQLEQGIGAIINSIVGLIVYILMFAIVNFIVPGGILQ